MGAGPLITSDAEASESDEDCGSLVLDEPTCVG